MRFWILRLLPFMHRWFDAAPAACCGVCGPCLTAAASGLTLEAVGNLRRGAESVGPDGAESVQR